MPNNTWLYVAAIVVLAIQLFGLSLCVIAGRQSRREEARHAWTRTILDGREWEEKPVPTYKINMRKLYKNHTITIKIRTHLTYEWRIRTAIASALMRMAAYVLGCKSAVEHNDENNETEQA